MREPRLGFLDYMLRDYHPHSDKDIVFIPVGINYDRVIEDRSLVRRLDDSAERRSAWFVMKTTVVFIIKNSLLSRKNRWLRFGYASVNFGEPLSAKKYCQENNIDFSILQTEQRFAEVEKLANIIMGDITAVVPVTPVALVCEALVKNRHEWKSELELKSFCSQRIDQMETTGAPVDISHSALEGVLSSAFDALLGRGLVEEKDNLYRMKESEAEIVNYYANSIVQWQ
jgi:glycerol-3-phosphate O-acyltransferase